MKIIFASLLILFVSSCKQSPEFQYSNNTLSFTCPKGWEITEEEEIDFESRYLSIEKQGVNESGLLTLTTLDFEADLDDWIEIYKNELKNEPIHQNSNLKFTRPKESVYGRYNTVNSNYSFTFLGVQFTGEIHVFTENGSSFSVVTQEAKEDVQKNLEGFKKLESSLLIN